MRKQMKKKTHTVLSIFFMLFFLWMLALRLQASDQTITPHSVIQRKVTIRGQSVSYSATVGSLKLHDSGGRPTADMFYTEYLRRNIGDPSGRPILFAWNGGPIASSAYLHLGVLGPRRIATDAQGRILPSFELVDNEHCPLDRADIVLIDPVGTGFSTPIGSNSGEDFWGIEADARAFAQFISHYLKITGRTSSPVYTIGESYGTIRSAVLTRFLQDEQNIPLTGVILVSSALDGNVVWTASGHMEPYFFRFPSFAAAAWYHRRIPNRPEKLEDFLNEVEHFTLTEFISAIFRWPNLPDEERRDILDKLHGYTGVSREFWESFNLRVGHPFFSRELLKDQNLILLASDTRETYSATDKKEKENPFEAAIKGYLRSELGMKNFEDYVVVKSIPTWDWRYDAGRPNTYRRPEIPTYQNFLDDLADAMKRNPQLHISLHSGVYDMTTAYFPAEWSTARMDIPDEMRGRVEMSHYEGGHMFYLVPSEQAAFTQNLVKFIDTTSRKGHLPTSDAEDAVAHPEFDILLSVIKKDGEKITHMGVELELPSMDKRSEEAFTLRAPVIFAGVDGIADRVEGLRVTDEKGVVDLEQMEDKADAGGFIYWRKWKAKRATVAPIKVKYRCALPERVPRLGPPFDLRNNGGGISGAGYGFLALPEEPGLYDLHLRWDLRNMDPGSKGITSLGEGDFQTVCPLEQVFSSYFMAGPLGRFPDKGDVNGFSSAWVGEPPFDAIEMMEWSSKACAALKKFFRDKSSDPYRFFMRIGPDNNGVGGAGLTNSFMLFVPVEQELTDGARGTIAHEMTHNWVGLIEGPPGATFWFSEGLVVHYTRLLMFRAGLFSLDEFLEDANATVVRYLTNPLRNLPNDRIEERFWQDRNAQVIPYDRGSLYFAHVDAKIRAASEGKRSLDDVILEMFDRRKNGEKLTKEMWLELLQKELGPSATEEFNSVIIRGEDFLPDSDAFGPLFNRVPVKLHVLELGFDERKTLYSRQKRVVGLKKGSAAERAGLRNGDWILNTINMSKLRRNEELRLKLKVQRGDQRLEIEYLPRGEFMDGYKWIRIKCNLYDCLSESSVKIAKIEIPAVILNDPHTESP
jgi:carboxypeptidase C (cathepsin A)